MQQLSPDATPLMRGLCVGAVLLGGCAPAGSEIPTTTTTPRPPASAATPSRTVDMVTLAGGTFTMGGRPEAVTVMPFSLDATEVTVGAYAACVRAGTCTEDHTHDSNVAERPPPNTPNAQCNYGTAGRDDHPMNCVDWEQAAIFCRAQDKRLPTEEEWEWAARRGAEGAAYPWGNARPGSQPCWSGVTKRGGTCTVGSNPDSDAPGGIHDLAGNVWEWTSGTFDASATTRIQRGGCFGTTDPARVGAAMRHWVPPSEREPGVGFRCARTASPASRPPRPMRRTPDAKDTPGFERWRGALEGYVSAVELGSQTRLDTSRFAFATYLSAMHNRIHPPFAALLTSLDALPAGDPMNTAKMFTRLEVVLAADGRVVKMGVVASSGVAAFDIATLDAVQRASPFGPAPAAILSADGQVYLQWELHRDEVIACSTINAWPFLLTRPAPARDPSP